MKFTISKKLFGYTGVIILIILSLVGWYVLFSQKPILLAKARQRYLLTAQSHKDLTSGPCLGLIADDWVLDIAHLPRQEIDNLPQNQCPDFLNGKAHHFIEMSPSGEVISVH